MKREEKLTHTNNIGIQNTVEAIGKCDNISENLFLCCEWLMPLVEKKEWISYIFWIRSIAIKFDHKLILKAKITSTNVVCLCVYVGTNIHCEFVSKSLRNVYSWQCFCLFVKLKGKLFETNAHSVFNSNNVL